MSANGGLGSRFASAGIVAAVLVATCCAGCPRDRGTEEGPITFGQLRSAALDHVNRHPREATVRRNWLLQELNDTSFDAEVVSDRFTVVNGWTIDLSERKMYKERAFGGPRIEVYNARVTFDPMGSDTVVKEVRTWVDWIEKGSYGGPKGM